MNVCLAQPRAPAESESFIRAHDDRFLREGRGGVVYGLDFPEYTADGRPLLSPSWPARLRRSLEHRSFGRSWEVHRAAALARYLRREDFDVVLAEYGVIGAPLAPVCHSAGVPLVVHFHGYDAYQREVLNTGGATYRAMFDRAAALVAVSSAMVAQLARLGAPEKKIKLNPCGVDTQQFAGASPASAPPRWVAVGRFVNKKAPHLTLLAFRRVVDAVPDAELTMVGNGALLDACRQMARALGLEGRVCFPGALAPAEVAALLRGARAFVQHSVTSPDGDAEGTPVAILEAGATGLPVVATRHAGIPDVVIHGQTGLLVDEYDVDGMAQAMLSVARDPALAQRLGQAARERIVAAYSLERSLAGLEAILEEARR